MNDHNEMFAMKNMPQEINVDPKKTYNSQFMPTMTSSCRPEVDGFFGATSGDYIKVQYGFQVETQPLSQINNVLNVVKDHIVDSILINTFPEMCGSRRSLHQIGGKEVEEGGQVHPQQRKQQRSLVHTAGHPSGFRFLKFREEGTCQPTTVPTNFCGVVTGTVYVYGRHQDGKDASLQVLSFIEKVLNVVDSTTIHSELLAIKPVKELNKVSGTINGKAFEDNNPGGNDGGLSRTGILLVVIACLLVCAIAYYMYIRYVERKESDTMMASPPSKKRQQIQWRRPMRGLNKKFFQKSSSSSSSSLSSSKFKDYDVNQNSIYPKVLEEDDDDDVVYEEEEIIEEEEYYEDGDDDEDYIDREDVEYHDDDNYDQGFDDDVGRGLEGFVDELNGVDDEQRSQVSRYTHKSGQSRRSRTSEASSRRREEFERLREKTLLPHSSTTSSDDRGSSSPYYDDDNHSGLV